MTASEAPWRTLEPASLLVNLIPDLWRTARNLWPFLVAAAVGGTVGGAPGGLGLNLGLIVFFFVSAALRTILHFATLRYRVNAGRLEIRSGLVGRQHRVIDPARIQNMEIVQNLFQRAAGLVELRIETAGDRGAEGLLSALSKAEADRLRRELDAARAPARPRATAEAEVVLEMSAVELVGYGMTAGWVGASAVAVGVMMELSAQWRPDAVGAFMAEAGPRTTFGWLLVGMAMAWALSVGSALLRWYGFRLSWSEAGIAAESGLLTRRRMEIPVRKVQAVHVEERLLRRWMGYATLHVETAGSSLPTEEQSSDAVLPMVEAGEVERVLPLLLPTVRGGAFSAAFQRPPRSALWRSLFGATLRYALLSGLAAWLGAAWVGAVLMPAGWLLAWLDWRRQGWALLPDALVCRRGFLRRETWIVPREKVQSVHLLQGPLLRSWRLARVGVWVAGSRATTPLLHEQDASLVFEALRPGQPSAGAGGVAAPGGGGSGVPGAGGVGVPGGG